MATSATATQRLRDAAADLRPTRAPYYMSIPDAAEPAPGWYLVPAESEHPIYLGHNVFAAFERLLTMRSQQPRRGAAA